MEIIRRRIEEREKVIKKAQEWARELKYKVTAILVGSYARGDFNKWSDVDVIIITDDIEGYPLERLSKIDIPPGYEVVIWTTNELRKMLEKRNPLAIEALKNGILLRDDLEIFKNLEIKGLAVQSENEVR